MTPAISVTTSLIIGIINSIKFHLFFLSKKVLQLIKNQIFAPILKKGRWRRYKTRRKFLGEMFKVKMLAKYNVGFLLAC